MPGPCADQLAAAAAQVFADWRHARRRLIRRHAGKSAVHAWRIASRRLFAVEELLAPAAAPRRSAAHRLLEDAFHAAGQLRDVQLAIDRLQRLARRFPAAERLAGHLRRALPRRRDRVRRLVRKIRPRDVRAILLRLQVLRDPDVARLGIRAARRLERAHSRLRRAAGCSRTAHSLHGYRVQLKSLRYMREFGRAGGLHPPSRRGGTPRIARLQHQLGRATDLRVLLQKIDRFGHRHPVWRREAASLRGHLLRQHQRLLESLPGAVAR